MEIDIDDIIVKYRILKESSFYPFEKTESDSDLIKKRKDSTRSELESLEQEINGFSNPKQLVLKFKNNLLKAVEILLGFVQKSNTGSPLDRNQGLVIENFIYGKVAGIINDSLKNGDGVSFPDFYYQPGGDFDQTELRNLLLEFQSDLQKEFLSYFELENCVEEYLDKIKELWNKEDVKVLGVSQA